ncbi:hypothetical protein TREMEDRAFT_63609 [Tremella mesenterica DSM 1558]|uniref:uncharacterized protein n=1 Tax=Tremella mesenterica (strain ATCC 24925 / CBS 8224 / DSM 1558 / NBRC 9311 / NRRL Y-6157 / RJB 2259-6 / UBC 559-6) TaxID=578456 RepID=UPI0003F49AB0|nr:uncharacterized protein TREMEDRAFT_63609 [Tremella mesenterica DSM 1558]EIW68442.1 hypothetical protein TREMEDRAFT_63609 [Tremella mesenterica DSM 1558]
MSKRTLLVPAKLPWLTLLDNIKDQYQSGPSRTQPSLLPLDQATFKQYVDFKGGAEPPATGENPSPAKSVESEHGTIVPNPDPPGKQPAGPPSEASDELVEVPTCSVKSFTPLARFPSTRNWSSCSRIEKTPRSLPFGPA